MRGVPRARAWEQAWFRQARELTSVGYTTTFEGAFMLNRPMKKEHADYLRAFNKTRRVKRDERLLVSVLRSSGREFSTALFPDPIREAALMTVGVDGGYFVGGTGFMGQDQDASIVDYNSEPQGQPSLWCHWVPADDDTTIVWDGGEKFTSYIEWLEYLIEHFIKPWGYSLTGRMTWQGEEDYDQGVLGVEDNNVYTMDGPERRWHNAPINTEPAKRFQTHQSRRR